MSVSDPIADMLTKVRNATMVRCERIDVSSSKLKLEIVKILKKEGYISNFKKIDKDRKNILRISLKYNKSRISVVHGLKKISTPGCRVYSKYRELPCVYNGYGTAIVSTSFGVLTGKKAAEKMVGGELLCIVW